MFILYRCFWCGPLAQLVEQLTLNQRVRSSSLRRPTKPSDTAPVTFTICSVKQVYFSVPVQNHLMRRYRSVLWFYSRLKILFCTSDRSCSCQLFDYYLSHSALQSAKPISRNATSFLSRSSRIRLTCRGILLLSLSGSDIIIKGLG